MGDASTVLSIGEARHLLRRTGFGAPQKEVAKLMRAGKTRGEVVDQLLKFKPKKFTPLGRFRRDEVPGIDHSHDLWLSFMLTTKSPLQEKLVLFWHDHFATNSEKVGNTVLMAAQNALLRSFCKGNFRDFVKAINRNAAMIEFLDTVRNHREVPNENYARELMELFTLGVRDSAGNDNYLQEDIVQIARAFTGWDYNDKGVAVFEDYDHDFMADYPERGPKVIFKVRGGFGAGGRSFAVNGEGATEIDAVIDILFAHTDSDGQNTVARRIARRLLEYFAHADPDLAVIDEMVATSGFATNWDVAGLLRAILVHDAFYETAAPPPFGAATKKSVKWPVDYVVSTLRLVGVRPVAEKEERIRIAGGASLHDRLTDMGQHLFEPPSVFGWDWETAWISSATLLARYAFARDVVSARVKGKKGFHPEKLIPKNLTEPGTIVDAVTEVLGMTDQMGATERAALIDYLTDGGLVPALDLSNVEVRNTKLHGLFALVLESPAYQLQ